MALCGRIKNLGEEHPDTADTLYNIAKIYENQGHYSHALGYYQRAFKTLVQVYGHDHQKTRTVKEAIERISRHLH